tara:strand:- start:81 stop:275 length:195 start_codon:yes stop_codon:yes gene_type:complete
MASIKLPCHRCGQQSGYTKGQASVNKKRTLVTPGAKSNNDENFKIYFCSDCWELARGLKHFGVE